MKTLQKAILGAALAFGLMAPASAQPAGKLKGTVVDAAGQPIAGATVESFVYDMSSRSSAEDIKAGEQTQTSASGAFELPTVPDGAVIVARKAGLAPAWQQIYRMTGGEHRLMLVPAGVMAGVVVDETDKPVPNAKVAVGVGVCVTEMEGGARSFGHLTGKIARELFNARTDADGRFRIEGFPTNASAGLTVNVPGKALRQSEDENWSPETLPCRAGQEDIRLVVEPAGTVEGQIVVESGAQPVPAARLMLQPDGPGGFGRIGVEPATSGADGKFQITSVPEGSYRIRASFGTNAVPDWVAEMVPVSVAAGQTTADVKISAVQGGLVEVMVRGKSDGKPQAQVGVSAYKSEYQAGSHTDSNGLARLRLPPGDYQLQAYRQGSSPQAATASVENGKTNRVEIELAGAQKLTGVVHRPDGQPAAGLPVSIVGMYGRPDGDAKTDENGKFELDWMPQNYGGRDATWCIFVRDAEHNLAVAQDLEEENGPLDLRLEPGLTVVGSAICDGKPITNATAALVFWTGNSGMHLRGLAVSKGPGQFEISALPPGRRYGLYVSAPGYGQKYVNSVESGDDSKRTEIEPVELKPAKLQLAGQVVDDNDKPVAGANVNLNGDGQPNENVRTDREGRFHFDHVCEGTIQLFSNSRNMHGSVFAEGGDTNVVLKLGESYSSSPGATTRKLQGVVTGPDGQPVAEAQVAVFPWNDSRSARTGTNGAFNLTWSVQPWQMQSGGDPLLVVRDLAHDLAAAEPIPEDSTNLNVQLQRALTFKGRVADAAGQAIAGAELGVWLRAGNTYGDVDQRHAIAGTNGTYEVKCLPAGQTYIVYAKAKGYGRSQQNIEAGSESNPLELSPFALKLADQVLSGQVVDDNDKPVSGANVNLSGDDQPEGYMTTDKNGRFHFKVCEGQVRLYANAPNGGYANATFEAGDTNAVIQLTRSGSSSRPEPRRLALKGRPLPDLTPLGLAADAVPADKPVLLCLLDAEQRPSRHLAHLLSGQSEDLKQTGVSVLFIQARVVPDESVQSWTNANPLPFPLGRVAEKTSATKWATEVDSLPWLILRDADGKVSAEGFGVDELDAKLGALKK